MIVIKRDMTFAGTIRDLGVSEEKISENLLELTSRADEFDVLYNNVKSGMLRKKYTLQDIRELMLCLDEAFSNAITWGNRNDESKKVFINYYISRSFCAVEIKDQGDGFDVQMLSEALSKNQENSIPVRGLYFINKYADIIFFNEKGNNMLLIKHNHNSN